MLNLDRFAKEEIVTMPIVDGWGQYNSRKVYAPKTEDGWYRVKLAGNTSVERKASQLEIYKALKDKKSYRVFALGSEGIPLNFDIFIKHGWAESVSVNFLTLNAFEVAKIVYWEDKRFYYYEPESKVERVIRTVKERFEHNGTLSDVSGTTPELRYYFILCCLQRDSGQFVSDLGKFVISATERDKRIAAYKKGFSSRLMDAIIRAGGTYVSHTRKASGYNVTWVIGGQTVKTFIRDDMRIVTAGFCLSGDDKKHTMNSLVHLAKMFQEDKDLYITTE